MSKNDSGKSKDMIEGGEIDRIRRDFLAAIERLVANCPRDPELIRARKEGKLRINFASVALEAKHSRTHISLNKCRLPDVRKRVLDLMAGRESAGSAIRSILRLRSELRDKLEEIELLRTGNAELMAQRDEAEKEAKRWRDAYQRCRVNSENERKLVRLLAK